MTDHLTKKQRSSNMSRIRSKDTAPEIAVRKKLHSLGFRFRLHDRKITGNPDIIMKKYMAALFVHGCFWHQHEGCRFASVPKSNRRYWLPKLEKNKLRDQKALENLKENGWKTAVVWECETKKTEDLNKAVDNIIRQFGNSAA